MFPCTLFLLLFPQSPFVHAQHRQRAPAFPPRLVALGNYPPAALAVDGTGLINLACSGALVRIDRTDLLMTMPLGGTPRDISADGRYIAGSWEGSSGYGECVWWEMNNGSLVFHQVAPGDPGSLSGVENTSNGVVLVGSIWGEPIDLRPPQGWSNLPWIGPWPNGSAWKVSADGRTYSGSTNNVPVRWFDRVPEPLPNPSSLFGTAEGLSPDGANFAGYLNDGRNRPVVWLARDGLMPRTLLGAPGASLEGVAAGVLDDELVFGTGKLGPGGEEFGWIWHPDLGTDSVVPMQQWLGSCGLPAVVVRSVSDVVAAGGSYHFALGGRRTGLFTSLNWYAETPRQ